MEDEPEKRADDAHNGGNDNEMEVDDGKGEGGAEKKERVVSIAPAGDEDDAVEY